MIFESSAWLYGLLALPLGLIVHAWLSRRDQARLESLISRPLWARVVRRPSERWLLARLVLLAFGALGMVVALARPQWGIVREKVEREGVDVVLVLDTSGSMATADVAPSRFFLARQALLQLLARLEGDRFALVAFEGEAYPLVPLTLDADALGLFLDTVEPGIVPAAGTSLGSGLAKGLDTFVDRERRNKVLVLVSDGEDLEGHVDEAVRRAKEAGVVVHTVGVGTEAGQPVPEVGPEGRVTGYKRDAQGNAVVSRLDAQALEAIARGTGGRAFRLSASDTSLSALAATIEGMEQKALAREYSYRRKERFQVPLALGLACITTGLLLPPPRPLRQPKARDVTSRAAAAVLASVLGSALLPGQLEAQEAQGRSDQAQAAPSPPAAVSRSAPVAPPPAASPGDPGPAATPAEGGPRRGALLDEVLLRPRRATADGRAEYARGNHPQALQAFERAATARPQDPAVRFNVADGLYKNGRYDEAATLFRSLGAEQASPLAPASRFNLGNSLYQKQDYRGAVQAYRDALRAAPGDADTRRNLELALRKLQEQEQEQKRQQDRNQQDQQDREQKDKEQSRQDKKNEPQKQEDAKRQKNAQQPSPPETPQEREDKRFRQEAGMPKERAMQLLEALQQNEKAEQKKALEAQRAKKKPGKDW